MGCLQTLISYRGLARARLGVECLKKNVPITRRASSFLVFFCIHVNRKEEGEGETEQQQQQQTYQFIKGCNILHRL